MKDFKTSLLLLLSSIPLIGGKVTATVPAGKEEAILPPKTGDEPVRLRPLNLPFENKFAAHRSHSSHASHRSSSGGGYTPAPQPQPQAPKPGTPSGSSGVAPTPPGPGVVGPGTAQPTDPGRAAPVSPKPAPPAPPTLTTAEKLTLQIMRVQIALTTLGLLDGEVTGKLDTNTQEAVKRFQRLKGLEANGRMTTDTLNALGVPAVQ
jgi:His-Xaa-Ser repeat protein HxsA